MKAAAALRLQDPPAPSGESLAEDVYQVLKWKILTRKVQPGTLLTEDDLCTLVGYGRTPVHQALHRLKYDGLVEILPRKGILVRALTPADLLEIYDVLIALEGAAADHGAALVIQVQHRGETEVQAHGQHFGRHQPAALFGQILGVVIVGIGAHLVL